MSDLSHRQPPSRRAAFFLPVAAGVAIFLIFQYAVSLHRLQGQSGAMMNKFSSLARENYLGFLIVQNAWMLVAYAILALAFTLLLQPVVQEWTLRSGRRGFPAVMLRALIGVILLHGYCTLRLIDKRPYFLSDAEFGHWYYRLLDIVPEVAKPASHLFLFSILPLGFLVWVALWHLRHQGKRGWIGALILVCGIGALMLPRYLQARPAAAAPADAGKPWNVIIIGSDSLRADRLGVAGYRPERTDGAAAQGVSPTIDALARRSVRFENCFTPIASTLESGTSLMSAMYPHSHGLRQMYPDRKTVEQAQSRIVTLPALLRERGYDTAAIGDWCAGYYEVMPLGMEHVSVSSFDNFKIYMSQAVVMSHFIVPLYFDNALGYRLFPQLASFAQFVTPEVVTQRVEKRLAAAAKDGRPFFWHVFYSCNHLPYRSSEPYNSMFSDPAYNGPNRYGVDFDIDEFIGGTDLESKWRALPPKEVLQIRSLYDGCTRQFDDCVKRILAALERQNLTERTIVIITADHGDDLYEPGVTLGHGLTFNGGSQANHIPMIVHIPGTPPDIIPEAIRLIDVIPTLADLTQTPKPDVWDGRSFAGWLDGSEAREWRPFYGETGFPFIQFRVPGVERPALPPMDELTSIDESFNYQFVLKDPYLAPLIRAKQRCLKTRHWKLICTPTAAGDHHYALYQLSADPFAERDVAASRPEVLLPLRHALERWMDDHVESSIAEIFPGGEPL